MGMIAEIAVVLIVVLVSMRAAIRIYSFTGRSWRTSRLDREYIERFKTHASTILKQSDSDRDRRDHSWDGKRKFQVVRRQYENQAGDICSFYLAPSDNRPIPPFYPGQYLTFKLPGPRPVVSETRFQQDEPIVRCYSLSDSPYERQQTYRITVKRLGPPAHARPGTPPGLSSSYFHERLAEGGIVDVLAPAGEFCLDLDSQRPVVLVAGGVGLTPLVSMLNWLIATRAQREIWLFYGVRNRAGHAMYDHLQRIRQNIPNVRIVIFYSAPSPACRIGIDYDVAGRVSVELMTRVLYAGNYEFYICGPSPMMKTLREDLAAWGVPESDIRTESFGSASFQRPVHSLDAEIDNGAGTFQVVFARSGKTVRWSKRAGTLLELAEACGVKARYGCRAGNCGTCVARLRQGEVDYIRKSGKAPGAGACLPCIANPKTDLVLDL